MKIARSLFYFVLTHLTITLSGQADVSNTSTPRSFASVKADIYKNYGDHAGHIDNKQALRTLHYLHDRLDANGNVINTTAANIKALQQLYIDTISGNITGNWQHWGPNFIQESNLAGGEGAGRVNCIAFASANTWYVGTAGGGLWKTTTAGVYFPGLDYPWTPLTDNLPVNSVSGVVVNPNDTSEVYILTGDGDGSGVTIWGGAGIGVLKSTDGGITWNTTTLQFDVTQLESGFKLIAYPGSPDTMFAATSDGIYRTLDGWETSTQVREELCFDIEFHPTNPEIIYAAGKDWIRRSDDGGDFFSNASIGSLDDVSIGQSSRIALAVTPDLPDAFYAILADEDTRGLLSMQFSADMGVSFTEVLSASYNILTALDPETDSTGQGEYDLAIWANPSNYIHVIVGGIDLWETTTGGATWQQLTEWAGSGDDYIHADVHMLEKNPFTGDLVVGTDGGISVSEDGGDSWSTRSKGLGITELYHFDIGVSPLGFATIGAGAQDNGTSFWLAQSNGQFMKFTGGDGFRVYSGDNGYNLVRYTAVQNGKLQRYDIDYDIFFPVLTIITPDQVIDGNGDPTGAWDTPYAPSANNIDELMAGYRHLYYNSNGDDEWQQIEVDGYNSDDRIIEIEWSNSDPNVFYFLMTDGNENSGDSIALFSHLWRVGTLYGAILADNLDLGNTSLMVLDTLLQGMLVTDLEENPNDPDELWFTVGGYAAGTKIFYNPNTVDSAFVNISYNLPNVPVHCAEYDDDGLYVGTEIGVFFLVHGDTVWQYHSLDLATAPVTHLEIAFFPWGKQIWAGTYGRGIWFSDPPPPFRRTRWFVDSSAVGLNDGSSWADAFTTLQIALDTIFPGDSIWVAAGTYKPETISGFSLLEDHVYIWGGFAGTEDSVSQRNFLANASILSGDIGALGDSLDNAYHVFGFSGANDGVLLDGFHITEGYGHGSGNNRFGGGIYYITGTQTGKPIIRNCRIYNNSATEGGAGMYFADFALGDPGITLSHCHFENNRSLDHGGGLYIDSSPSSQTDLAGAAFVQIDTCTFINNHGSLAGGIYAEAYYDGTIALTIDSALFEGNSTEYTSFSGRGPAILADMRQGGGMTFSCSNALFAYMEAPSGNYGAGAIFFHIQGAEDFSATFNHCVFDSLDSAHGGAIQFYGATRDYSASFDNCIFKNITGRYGGAINFFEYNMKLAEVSFSNCLFENNFASQYAGAVFFDGGGGAHFEIDIDSTEFLSNSAGSIGALRFAGTKNNNGTLADFDIQMSDCLFEGNHGGYTGAIDFYNSNSRMYATLERVDFIGNAATSQLEGAIQHEHFPGAGSIMNFLYKDCNFINNSAKGTAGAVSHIRTNATYDGCNFTDNTAFGIGGVSRAGAAYLNTDANTGEFTYHFNKCNFTGNSTGNSGGAIYALHGDPTNMIVKIDSCVFDNNETLNSTGNGGAYMSDGNGRSRDTISNTTFSNNFTNGRGGAIYAASTAPDTLNLIVLNSNFSNNTANSQGKTVYLYASGSGKLQSLWSDCTFSGENIQHTFYNHRVSSGVSNAVLNDCDFVQTMGLQGLIEYDTYPPFPVGPCFIQFR